jgi:hypothetical protein
MRALRLSRKEPFEVGRDRLLFRQWGSGASIVPGRDATDDGRGSGQRRAQGLSDNFAGVSVDDSTSQHCQVTADVSNRVGLGKDVGSFEVAPAIDDVASGEAASSVGAFGPVRDPSGG